MAVTPGATQVHRIRLIGRLHTLLRVKAAPVQTGAAFLCVELLVGTCLVRGRYYFVACAVLTLVIWHTPVAGSSLHQASRLLVIRRVSRQRSVPFCQRPCAVLRAARGRAPQVALRRSDRAGSAVSRGAYAVACFYWADNESDCAAGRNSWPAQAKKQSWGAPGICRKRSNQNFPAKNSQSATLRPPPASRGRRKTSSATPCAR